MKKNQHFFNDYQSYLISPEILLKQRFGKKYTEMTQTMPTDVILSFFHNSISIASKELSITKQINWFGSISQIAIIEYKGIEIALVSLPLGGSLASMILEELIFCGADRFISIGLAGGISKDLLPHDIIIPTASLKEDGVSNLYLPKDQVPVASDTITKKIEKTLIQSDLKYHKGLCWSISTPYRENREIIAKLQKEKVLTVDMEVASLFAVANHREVDLASLFSVSDIIVDDIWTPHFKDKRTIKMNKLLLYIALDVLSSN